MRRLLYLATLLVGMALGSLYPLSLLAQTRSAIGNMQADNAAAGSRLGLSVVVLDGSGNPVTSFGGSGGTASRRAGCATSWTRRCRRRGRSRE